MTAEPPLEPPSPWPARAQAAAPFLLFALAVAVLLGPSLVGSRVALAHDLHLHQLPWRLQQTEPPLNLELRDTVDQYYPVQNELLTRLRGGEVVTWLRGIGLGYPGVQFIGWGALSPFNLPALVLPFDLAWSWSMALRLYAAMVGAYLLVRGLGAGRAGATVAGLSFGLCGYMVGWLGWPQSHVGAVIPWLLWAVRKATTGAAPPWWSGPAVAIAVASLWLGGFPAVTLYALIAAGVVALHGLVAAREHGGAAVVTRAIAVGGGVVVGTMLVAFTLLPSLAWLDSLDLSARASALQAHLTTTSLWTMVVPDVFGDVVHYDRWLPGAYVETVGYAGAVTLALVSVAWALRPRRSGVWLFTGLGIGAGLAAYGFPPLLSLLGLVPSLATNSPARAQSLLGLCVAVVGGLGADAALRWCRGRARLDRRVAVAIAVGLAALAALIVFSGAVRELSDLAFERLGPERFPEARAVAINAALRRFWLLAGAAIVVALGALAARRLPERAALGAPPAAAALLASLVALDMISFAGGWNVQVPRQDLFPDAPGTAELRELSRTHRVAGADEVGHANTNLEYGINDFRSRGFLTERQREVLQELGAVFHSPTRWDLTLENVDRWEPWLSAAGVRAVLAPEGEGGPPPGWSERRLDGVRLLLNPHARPLVSAVPRAEAVGFGQADDALERAGVEALDRVAHVETTSSVDLPEGDSAVVRRWRMKGARTSARVESDEGAVLVVLDADTPGWTATVDGAPADVVTVDHLFVGVVVPPGERDVVLTYEAPGLTAGVWLSVLGLGLLLASALGARLRARTAG